MADVRAWFLRASSVHLLFSDAARLLKQELGNDFAFRHFSEFGYMLVDNDSGSRSSGNESGWRLKSKSDTPVAPRESSRQRRLRILGSASADFETIPVPLDYFVAHAHLIKLENWELIRAAMNEEADEILSEIPKGGHLKESLARRTSNRTIPAPAVIRTGIARRVVLPWAFQYREKLLTGHKLGFETNMKAETSKQKQERRKKIENFEKFLKQWQLKDMNFSNPEDSVILTDDEKNYVTSHRV